MAFWIFCADFWRNLDIIIGGDCSQLICARKPIGGVRWSSEPHTDDTICPPSTTSYIICRPQAHYIYVSSFGMCYIIHLTLCVLHLSASSLHLCHQYILCTESYILHLYASIHLTLYTCWPQHSSRKLILHPADALGGHLTSYIADAQGGRLTSYISILQ